MRVKPVLCTKWRFSPYVQCTNVSHCLMEHRLVVCISILLCSEYDSSNRGNRGWMSQK